MKSTIDSNTPVHTDQAIFLVALFPPSISRWVMDIRNKLDPEVARLPAEITISGSSGIGVLAPETNLTNIQSALAELAELRMPSPVNFLSVKTFPFTEIRWLSISDESYFIDLHQRARSSMLPFGINEFPYQPHCTIHLNKPWTVEKQAVVDSISIPSESFVVTKLAAIKQTQSTRECTIVAQVDL